MGPRFRLLLSIANVDGHTGLFHAIRTPGGEWKDSDEGLLVAETLEVCPISLGVPFYAVRIGRNKCEQNHRWKQRAKHNQN